MPALTVHKNRENRNLQTIVCQSMLGLTAQEIATREGVTIKTIERRLRDGVKDLNIPELLKLGNDRLMSMNHKALENIDKLLDKNNLTDKEKIKLNLGIIDRSIGFLHKAILAKSGNNGDSSPEISKMSDEQIKNEAQQAAVRLLAHYKDEENKIKSERNEVKTADFEVIEQVSESVTPCDSESNDDELAKQALSDKLILKANRPARVIKRRLGRNMQRTRPAQPDSIEPVHLTKRYREDKSDE